MRVLHSSITGASGAVKYTPAKRDSAWKIFFTADGTTFAKIGIIFCGAMAAASLALLIAALLGLV